MRIVIDTNILIRILISPDGLVAGLYFPLKQKHDLYISYNSIEEINKHKPRLLRLSGLKAIEFEELFVNISNDIAIVPFGHIADTYFVQAMFYTSGVDYDDVPFVATALFLNASFWTSDKTLASGLKKKGFATVLNNADIRRLITDKS
jgi:predicted nucleic acid-binding protein